MHSSTALKRLYTEEPHHSFLRPAASVIVRLLKNTPVSANQVTLVSAAAGIAAGILTGTGQPAAGGIFLFAAMVLDCSDGQLARLKGQDSRLGRILDGMADYTTAIAVHTGMAFYLSQYYRGAWIWVLAAAVSMGLHCLLFDYRKQLFLARTLKQSGGFDSVRKVSNDLKQSGSESEKFFLKIYKIYLMMQSGTSSGSSESLYLEERKRRTEFIKKAGPYMKMARLLGPAGHNFLIALSLILACCIREAPFFYALIIIFPFNIFFAAALIRGRSFKSW